MVGGHHLDEAGFGGITRLDLIFERGEDLLKAMPGFTLEDHGAAGRCRAWWHFGEAARLPSWAVGRRDLAPLARADSGLREAVILRVGYEVAGVLWRVRDGKWLEPGELFFGEVDESAQFGMGRVSH